MNHLEVVLAARSFRDGRAHRTALFRHRHFVAKPLTLVLWQLGAEPFSAAAVGFGRTANDLRLEVAGDPRNRDLAFAALLRVAEWFNPLFEAPTVDRETVRSGSYRPTRSRQAPQILVANSATVEMLGRLGRRLAYLRSDGPRPAPPALTRFGQHLLFLFRHWRTPGQQLVLALDELLISHWATSQSDLERASLAALNGFLTETRGHGFDAAVAREHDAVGPVPDSGDDTMLEPLLDDFNLRRANGTDPATIRRLIHPIEAHYRRLVTRTWNLIWVCREREASFAEGPSVPRRWEEDREAYTAHMDWMAISGRRRTRETPRQAAMLLHQLEEAKALLEAEEACDDPLRMIPVLLDGKAVQGQVVGLDQDHRELGPSGSVMVRRPLVTIASADPCLLPQGKELWWTGQPGGKAYEVHQVTARSEGGSTVTLKFSTSTRGVPMPALGQQACFSVHTTTRPWGVQLPDEEPWTHRPAAPADSLASLEESRG